jgi:hypothetical protein
LGNWAIWGYPESPSVVRDFGSQSPARAVQDYIAKHPSGPPFPQADRIFRELSFEAIRAHPRDYVALSFRSLWSLLVHGLSFTYESKPFGKLPAYIEREATLRAWFHKAEVEWPGEPIRDGNESVGVVRSFAVIQAASPMLKNWYLSLASVSPILLALMLLSRARFRGIIEPRRVLVVLCGLAIFYLTLLTFVCTGEPRRYLFNIQDLIVLIPLFLLSAASRAIRSLAETKDDPVSN